MQKNNSRDRGTVIGFNPVGQFGFIKSDQFGPDTFFHISHWPGKAADAVQIGAKVSYMKRQGPKGLRAYEITED